METKYTTLFKRISRTTTTESTTTTFKFVSAIPIDEYLNEYKETVRMNTTTMNKKIKGFNSLTLTHAVESRLCNIIVYMFVLNTYRREISTRKIRVSNAS